MTAVNPENASEQALEPRPLAVALARRLTTLLVRIRETVGEDVQVTIARAIDQAFAEIAREYRR